MAFKLNRSSKEPMSEINVTPFVDGISAFNNIYGYCSFACSRCSSRFARKFCGFLPEEAEPLTLTINSKGEIFIQESKVEYEKIIAKVLAVSKIELILNLRKR